jgi:hypothetical protein
VVAVAVMYVGFVVVGETETATFGFAGVVEEPEHAGHAHVVKNALEDHDDGDASWPWKKVEVAEA